MLPLSRSAHWRFLVLTFATLAWADGAATAADTQKRVLVINSTRRDVPISIVADRELPRIPCTDLGGQVDYSEYLDVPRFSDTSYRSAFRDFLRLKYRVQNFDLVIAMGAVVALKFDATLKMVAELHPDVRNMFVVTGARSRDKLFEEMMRAQFKATLGLGARLARLPAHSIVYYVLVYQDGAGGNFQPMNYLERLQAVASAPTYSWVDTATGRGIVGGSLLSLQAQTDAIAAVAFRVISGEPAGRIPTVSPDLNVSQVDWRQLRRWGISEARVPQGTIVKSKERDGWNRYTGYVVVGLIVLLAQSALIAGLLLQRRMRRRAEIRVRENEAALRASNERIHDLGGRLLLAQEAERARIARELHDDVNQQVALLAIDLELLREGGRERPDATTLIWEACERVHGVAKSLHDLSHQLHPARLRMLGLVPALNGLQRELSRPDCVIEFSSDNVPATLPQDITLCLFRVAQESLHNALTHSGAGNVSVHLFGEPNRLTMAIVDDGVGFDVTDAWDRGLGLVSMGERLESIDGTLHIESRPGSGTRVLISVPFRPEAITEIVPT